MLIWRRLLFFSPQIPPSRSSSISCTPIHAPLSPLHLSKLSSFSSSCSSFILSLLLFREGHYRKRLFCVLSYNILPRNTACLQAPPTTSTGSIGHQQSPSASSASAAAEAATKRHLRSSCSPTHPHAIASVPLLYRHAHKYKHYIFYINYHTHTPYTSM